MSPAAIELETAIIRKLFWRLLPFLFVLYVVNYLDRINVGFAALQMQQQLGLSDRVYGLGAGIFFAGYFFFQVPSNLVLMRVGPRRWISTIMALWGVLSCCMIFVHTPHEFYSMRFLLGAAEAGFFPGVILYLRSWFPAAARARAVACFMTASPVAGVIGSPVSGALLELHQFGIAGWQWMFLLEGLPAVLLAGVAYLVLDDRPQQAPWLKPEEKLYLVELLERANVRRDAPRAGGRRSPFLDLGWRLALLVVTYFGITSAIYGVTLWLPVYIHSLSTLSDFGIGVASVVPYLATAVAMVLVGIRSDRSANHRFYLCAMGICGSGGLFATAHTTELLPALSFLSLALMAAFSMQGPFWATATSLMGGTVAAAGVAIINSFGNLGGFFGPYIIGARRTSGGGFRGGMLVIATLLALATLSSLFVRARQERASPAAHNPLQ